MKAECDDPSVFLKPDIWPEGIYFRWYRSSKPSNASGQNKMNDGPDVRNKKDEDLGDEGACHGCDTNNRAVTTGNVRKS